MTISRPWKAPAMRPTLARHSSAASGLRFCGMIDEPVVKRSDSRTKPNCGVIQITISSASRDRCMAEIDAAASVSSAKSRSETPSSELAVGRSKPSAAAVACAIDRERRAGQRRRAERALVEPRAGIGEAAAVAAEHLDVGQQMVAEGHRLGRLQVREARHHDVGVRLGLGGERPLQLLRAPVELVDASRTYSRKSSATWSLRERAVCSRPAAGPISSASRLSTFMWMSSSFSRELELAALDLAADLLEALQDLARVGLGDDALRAPASRRAPSSRRYPAAPWPCRSRSRRLSRPSARRVTLRSGHPTSCWHRNGSRRASSVALTKRGSDTPEGHS